MARPRPQVAAAIAVLILFLVAEVISSSEAITIVFRPPHGSSNRHTMFSPSFSLLLLAVLPTTLHLLPSAARFKDLTLSTLTLACPSTTISSSTSNKSSHLL
ncbi:hypothetical protein CsSME_00001243 [Camellia sinensis var. sinensis]